MEEKSGNDDRGEAAVDFIRQFKVDFAVIGTSAIDADGTLVAFQLGFLTEGQMRESLVALGLDQAALADVQ